MSCITRAAEEEVIISFYETHPYSDLARDTKMRFVFKTHARKRKRCQAGAYAEILRVTFLQIRLEKSRSETSENQCRTERRQLWQEFRCDKSANLQITGELHLKMRQNTSD